MSYKKYLIVGAGFSGSVIAEQLSHLKNSKIVVIDERAHVGGHCYTERESETGVMVHKYGPHIFNTDNLEVWNYINNFCEMIPFINRVKAVYKGEVYSMPINLHTINQFFKKTFNPSQAKDFIENLGDHSIKEPKNFEEQALKMIGKDLYKAFFYSYTIKQWGCKPSELPASNLKRLPIRFNYNDNYYSNPMQGIPNNGYTAIFEKMLNNPSIELSLNTKFDLSFPIDKFYHIFYTGPIDAFFNYQFGKLGYRTLNFEKGIAEGDYQGNAVINYTDDSVPYTRISEHKHFTPWENHERTVYFKEFSKETEDGDVPYYPKRLQRDMEILTRCQREVSNLKNVTFLGRLATYRYLDMHHVIADALKISKEFIAKLG
jgi:UDP-galactopyranose mutase